MLREAVRLALSPLRRCVVWFLVRCADRVEVGGIALVDVAHSGQSLAAKMRGALDLIERTEPRRMRRIRTDVHRIVLIAAGPPEYWPGAKGFALPVRSVVELDEARLALLLVHEATHARLWNAGIRYRPSLRARIEKLCVNEEEAFARKLGCSGSVLLELAAKRDRNWWEGDHARESRVEALRELGWPQWLIRLYTRVT